MMRTRSERWGVSVRESRSGRIWVAIGTLAVAVDGLRFEELTSWHASASLFAIPLLIMASFTIAGSIWVRVRSWHSVVIGVALAASLPLALSMDLLGLSGWVLAAIAREPGLIWGPRTSWAVVLFGLHVAFMWMLLPFPQAMSTALLILTVAGASATSVLPMVLVMTGPPGHPTGLRRPNLTGS